MDRQGWVCTRLRDLGYAEGRHLRLYGKDLNLVSNPMVEIDGYSVESIERKSGVVHRMPIPLMVVPLVEKEAAMCEISLAGENSVAA